MRKKRCESSPLHGSEAVAREIEAFTGGSEGRKISLEVSKSIREVDDRKVQVTEQGKKWKGRKKLMKGCGRHVVVADRKGRSAGAAMQLTAKSIIPSIRCFTSPRGSYIIFCR